MTEQPLFTVNQVLEIYQKPLNDLIFQAQTIHRENFDPNEIQACSLVNIQSGGCPEDCKWCAQSVHHHAKIKLYPLMKTESVLEKARAAKAMGATRVCLGAAWRKPSSSQLGHVKTMIHEIKSLGLETCVTLGQLSQDQATDLKEAGLDYYNHNLETSPEHFSKMTSTRSYEGRLKTIEHVQESGLKVCSGGIVGMGESLIDQITLLANLANLKPQPKSVPINYLTSVEGTPLADLANKPMDEIGYIRLIAVARIILPKSYIRLSCGRERLSNSAQALAFLAGANSYFLGDTLLTVKNANINEDKALLKQLGMRYSGEPQSIPSKVCIHETND